MSEKHKLPFEAKIYIVRALACRERPRSILASIKERFGIELHRSTLTHYNPRLNSKLDPDLKSLYDKTAAAFWSEDQMAPLNSLNYRQQLRAQLLEEADRDGWLKLRILDSAVKDADGFFHNRPQSVSSHAYYAGELNVQAVANASAEDIAVILACFPLNLLPRDIAQWMLEKGHVPPSRRGELSDSEKAI